MVESFEQLWVGTLDYLHVVLDFGSRAHKAGFGKGTVGSSRLLEPPLQCFIQFGLLR